MYPIPVHPFGCSEAQKGAFDKMFALEKIKAEFLALPSDKAIRPNYKVIGKETSGSLTRYDPGEPTSFIKERQIVEKVHFASELVQD